MSQANREEKAIIVCCPAAAVSGGPELLHQLVHELRLTKRIAYICYYPFHRRHDRPEPYECYDAPQVEFRDEAGDIVVLPEVRTSIARTIKHARVAIWWMSVDNYYWRRANGWHNDLINTFRSWYDGRIPLARLSHFIHFTQSAYARDFLLGAGIPSTMLSDYLASEHFTQKASAAERDDVVIFNPMKGLRKTKELIQACPDITFVPIEGMSKSDVARALSRAKVYIDFGNHPGKDRMPREAAMAGCCVITGTRGAAGNDEDIPLPRQYKFDDNGAIDVERFKSTVKAIFSDFEAHSADFEPYRMQIRKEPEVFRRQVDNAFREVAPKHFDRAMHM